MPFIVCKQLVKAYRVADHEIVALRGVDFEMNVGETVAIVGPSGSGKSSLLNLLGGLDTPTAGRLTVGGNDLSAFTPREVTHYRLHRVGFLWQQVTRNLLSYRTVQANIELPMTLARVPRGERAARTRDLLESVGLLDYADAFPPALSGGQQQRVALAVALANRPALLLADEPTGALDRVNSEAVMALLADLRERYDLTVLLTTHDAEIADHADRVLTLRDGALGQDIGGGDKADAGLRLDEGGALRLPDAARSQLGGSANIAVEIRPEGVLLRPEHDDEDESGFAALLPQDAPPEPERAWWRRLFRRGGEA